MSERVLPEGWVSTTLGELCELNPKQKLDDELEVGFMPMTGVPTTFHEKPEFETRKWEAVKKGYTQFKDGDVLFAKITPCFENGKATVVEGFPCGWGAGSTEYHVLRPRAEVVDPRLLLAFVRTKDFLNNGELNMSGSVGHKRVPKDFIASYSFPLMPKEEQKLIADKLDELLAQVNNMKARLDAIPAILKRFRQSVLAAAVSGALSEEWRKINNVSFEYWEYRKAKDICEKVQSGSTPKGKPFDQGGDVPFLKVYNIVGQKVDFYYRPQFITKGVHSVRMKRSIAVPGDVLMNIVGPPLGKVAILDNKFPEWNINQAITLFRPAPEKLDGKYLYYVLCEGALVRGVLHDVKGIVGQVNISLTQCREALIPQPSLEEQREIVRRVDQLFAFADQIEQQVANAQTHVNKLTQSILAKAFRGELTAEWRAANPELISGEHSAEALLERIKAEKAKQTPTKTRRGGRKATVTS